MLSAKWKVHIWNWPREGFRGWTLKKLLNQRLTHQPWQSPWLVCETGACWYVLKNAWICFRTLFSWVGNNPSVQIHLFCKNQRKCNQTWNPTWWRISIVLIKQDLNVTDSSHLPWNEAYNHSLSQCHSHHYFHLLASTPLFNFYSLFEIYSLNSFGVLCSCCECRAYEASQTGNTFSLNL